MLREVVAEGFDAHAVHDGLAQRCFGAGRLAQDGQQMHGIVLAEAGVKLTLGVSQKLWLCGEMKPMRDSLPGVRQ